MLQWTDSVIVCNYGQNKADKYPYSWYIQMSNVNIITNYDTSTWNTYFKLLFWKQDWY